MQDDIPGFYSWETPDLELTINPSGSLVDYSDIVVTIHQGNLTPISYHKEDLRIDGDKIYLMIPQEDSGKFVGNKPACVQVNILYNDGIREATTHGEIWIKPNLYRKVMD